MFTEEDFPGYHYEFNIGSGGYDWAMMRVLTKDGRVFYGSASGCSCSDWSDFIRSEADLIELPTLESAKKAAKEFIEDNHHYFSDGVSKYLDAVEKFRALGLR